MVRRALSVLLLLLSLLPCLTAVGATLEGEVRWSGKRQIRESLLVPRGARLTIAAGSRIDFAPGTGLEVQGTLVAEEASLDGRDWDGLALSRVDSGTRLSKCRVQGARTALLVNGGNPALEGLVLEGNQVGVELKQQSRALVQGCLFRNNAKVGLFIKDGSTPQVRNNQFKANGLYGAYIYRAVPEVFENNRFEANETGLMIAYFGSDPSIEDNEFVSNGAGILVDRSAKPLIKANRLWDNREGIRLQRRSDARIQGNLLRNNGQALRVEFSSYPRIQGNDFLGNAMAVFLEHQSSEWEKLNGAASREQETAARGAFGLKPRQEVTEEQRRPRELDGTVDARGNWWGEAGAAEVRKAGASGNLSFIHDGFDQAVFSQGGRDYPLDRVLYHPAADRPQLSEGPKE